MPEESAETAAYVPMEQEDAERTHRVIGAREGTSNARFILVAKGADAAEYRTVDSLFKKTEQMLRDTDHFKVKREMFAINSTLGKNSAPGPTSRSRDPARSSGSAIQRDPARFRTISRDPARLFSVILWISTPAWPSD